MNVYEFVLGIIIIGTVASLIRLRMGVRKDNMGNEHPIRDDSREAAAMREEMKQLRDRFAVLERITVEKENSLEREIESLRDR